MKKKFQNPGRVQKIASGIFRHRYFISFAILILIVGFGSFVYLIKDWPAKDAAQICTGFLLVLTLFFTALNYEFSNSKSKSDSQAAKDLLTFNTASEWHNHPLTDYQKISIKHERQFMASRINRTVVDFDAYIDDYENLEYRESLKGILNAFETVANGVHKGLIDKEFIKDFYKSIFKMYYSDYIFFIRRRRVAQSNERFWINFTKLVEEWFPELKAETKNMSSIITN